MAETRRAELKYLIERQREEIKTLNEVGRLLSSTTDPQEIVRLVAAYLRQTFPLALCGVLFIEPRKLHLIQFTKIAQVDLAAATREICTKAAERLSKPLTGHELTCVIEDQSGTPGQGPQASIGSLRSSHLAPLAFNGHVIGWLCVFSGKPEAFGREDRHVIDIVADQLRAALRNSFLLDELKRANQLKQDLLMVISHELRTPLTSIQQGLGLILNRSLGPLSTEQHDFLNAANDSAERLAMLVEKVVTATQLVTGQLQYTFLEMDWALLLKELQEAFRPLVRAKGVLLDVVGATPLIRYVGDAHRLKQAVSHVVENAIQVTPAEGHVTVSTGVTPTHVELEVTDTGTGIPAEELPTIFEQFRIVGGIDDRKSGGLGLGLFIAKTIVEAHHGSIRLESHLGHGSRVTIRLPKEPPQVSGRSS